MPRRFLRKRETLRVALIQTRTPDNVAAAAVQIRPLVQKAVAENAELIVTPEFSNFLDVAPESQKRKASQPDDDAFVAMMTRIARETGVWVLIGSAAVLGDDGRLANRSLLIDGTGQTVARYDKIHLFEPVDVGSRDGCEAATFTAGRRAVVADTPWGGLGMTICYDLRFSYLHRRLAQAGATIIASPAAFSRRTGQSHWESLVKARAIETCCFVLAPAQGGRHEGGRSTWGRSMIVGPDGEVIAGDPGDEPGVVTATLDLTAVDRARAALPSWSFDLPLWTL